MKGRDGTTKMDPSKTTYAASFVRIDARTYDGDVIVGADAFWDVHA